MAVTDFFLNNTVNASSTTTIQPASGTIYSFKRGRLNAAQNTGAGFSISTVSGTIFMELFAQGSGNTNTSLFQQFHFSESGINVLYYTGINFFSNKYGGLATPFAAISNGNTVAITAGFTNAVKYTLIGVSMT